MKAAARQLVEAVDRFALRKGSQRSFLRAATDRRALSTTAASVADARSNLIDMAKQLFRQSEPDSFIPRPAARVWP